MVFRQNVYISALRASLLTGKMLQPAFVLRGAKTTTETKTITMARSLTKTKTNIKEKAKVMAKCMALH